MSTKFFLTVTCTAWSSFAVVFVDFYLHSTGFEDMKLFEITKHACCHDFKNTNNVKEGRKFLSLCLLGGRGHFGDLFCKKRV